MDSAISKRRQYINIVDLGFIPCNLSGWWGVGGGGCLRSKVFFDLGEAHHVYKPVQVLQGFLAIVFQDHVVDLCQQCGADLPHDIVKFDIILRQRNYIILQNSIISIFLYSNSLLCSNIQLSQHIGK